MQRFRRPHLCRLCQFPVVDGGVQLTREELDKVSDWLRQKVGQGLCISDKEEKETSWWICQFCSWDARFMDEHSAMNAGKTLVWWPQEYDKDYEKYYKDLLKPCFVNMENSKNRSADPQNEVLGNAISNRSSDPVNLESTAVECAGTNNVIANSKNEARSTRCVYCGKSFITIENMSRHVNIAHRQQAIRCTYYRCQSYFKTEEERSAHIKNIHENGRDMRICMYCNKGTKNLNRHIQKNHRNEIIRCSIFWCATFFKTEVEKEEHFKQVHATVEAVEREINKLKCCYCEKTTTTFTGLRLHTNRKHHEGVFRCTVFRCYQYFKTQLEMESHLKETHSEILRKQIYHCQKCYFKTCKKDSLHTHTLRVHVSTKLECFDCGRTFKAKGNLRTHFLTAHVDENKSCSLCQMSVADLQRHVKKTFCQICCKDFPCLGLKKQHYKLCKPTFGCSMCSKTFKMPHVLKYHLKSKHNLEWKGLEHKSKGFECKLCRKYYGSKIILRTHIYDVHRYKFTCDGCKKEFTSKSYVRHHMKSTSCNPNRKKEYDCFKCAGKFYSKRALKSHWLYIHVGKYYVECEECGNTVSKNSLRQHKKILH